MIRLKGQFVVTRLEVGWLVANVGKVATVAVVAGIETVKFVCVVLLP